MTYRVVYGETLPAWEREFPDFQSANAFAQKQHACGDIIFEIAVVREGDAPKSLAKVAELQRNARA